MTEKESIKFFRGLLNLAPSLLNLSTQVCMERMATVYARIFDITATREHIKIALAEHTRNKVKRRWDLKKRWLVAFFIRKPAATVKDAMKALRPFFSERTRLTVVESCIDEARRMRSLPGPEQTDFLRAVSDETDKRMGEGNVFTS